MGYTRDEETARDRAAEAGRVLWLILALNLAVAAAKLGYGVYSDSVGMTADGFHSMFDGTSNVIGLLGLYLASRPADPDHPYGHTKFETFASALIGLMLVLAAWRVGSSALARLVDGGATARVGAVSFGVMVGTLAVNIVVATYERRVGRRIGSELLVADANHTASDILVSLGVIAGLVLVRLGYPKADPVVGLLVALAIVYAAWEVFKQANRTLSDQARLSKEEVCDAALAVPGVMGCHSIRTRGTPSDVYIDLHIQVDAALTVREGHAIAESVEAALVAAIPSVRDVIAHLEPMDAYQAAKTVEENGGTSE